MNRGVARRTPREQGRENMLEAAVALLSERRPEDITVRDIAERAGHHHRFVATWFGGKTGLFRAAFDRIAAELIPTLGFPNTTGRIDPAAVRMVQLMNWLVSNDPNAFESWRERPVMTRVAKLYEDYGLDPDTAHTAAQRLVSGVIALVLFDKVLGITEDDIPRLIEFEARAARLLRDDT